MIYKVPSDLSHSVVLWFYEFIMITDNRSFRNMSRKMRILFFFFNQSYLFVNGSSWVIWFLTSCFPLLSIHYSFPRIQTDLLISCVYLCQMLSKEKKKYFFKTSHYSTPINAFGPVTLLCKTGCLPCPWQKMQCCSLITFFFVKSINVLFQSGVSIIFIIGKNTTFKIHLNLTSQLKGKNLLSIWLCQQIKTIGNKAISGKWSPLKKVSQPKVTQFQIL